MLAERHTLGLRPSDLFWPVRCNREDSPSHQQMNRPELCLRAALATNARSCR